MCSKVLKKKKSTETVYANLRVAFILGEEGNAGWGEGWALIIFAIFYFLRNILNILNIKK